MDLVSHWRRQAARATGITLIAPVALLLAAAIVASGGGLGGLGSLGQIAGGPELPSTGLSPGPAGSVADAEIVSAGLATGTAPGTTAAGTAGTVDGGAAPVTGDSPGSGPGVDLVPGAGTPRPPIRPPAGGQAPPAAAPPAVPPAAPPASPAPDPVADVVDTTRGLGESLPAPLGPTTGEILDSLPGPR